MDEISHCLGRRSSYSLYNFNVAPIVSIISPFGVLVMWFGTSIRAFQMVSGFISTRNVRLEPCHLRWIGLTRISKI